MSSNVPTRTLIRAKAARLHVLCPTITDFEWVRRRLAEKPHRSALDAPLHRPQSSPPQSTKPNRSLPHDSSS